MISTFSSSDCFLGNPFHTFDGGFTPWDCPELFPAATNTQSPEPGSDPVTPNSVSDGPVQSGSVSDVPKNTGLVCPEPDRAVLCADERKIRRMKSNRESARRSRMRKQKHVENLRNQANRFRSENRELTNRIQFASYHLHRVRTDNSRLRSEFVLLRQKWNDIRQLLLFQRLQQFPAPLWPCNTVVSEQTPSLIT